MKKLLLVDLDGTIRESNSGKQFISHPQDQRPIAGAPQAIEHFANQGYKIAGISNQGEWKQDIRLWQIACKNICER